MKGTASVTLASLVEAGIIDPGEGVLSVTVGGGAAGTNHFVADLLENGDIVYDGKVYKSPSSWSLYVKRLVNPSRLADDGWTSVKYRGELLKTYRPKRPLDLLGDSAAGAADGEGGPKRKKARRAPVRYAVPADDTAEEEEQFDGFEEDPMPSDGELGYDFEPEADAAFQADLPADDFSNEPFSDEELSEPEEVADELAGEQAAIASLAWEQHADVVLPELRESPTQRDTAEHPAAQARSQSASPDAFPVAAAHEPEPPTAPQPADSLAASPAADDQPSQPGSPVSGGAATAHAALSPADPMAGPPALHRGGMTGTGSEWIACDECGKWRQAVVGDVARGPWTCSMNVDPRFNTCAHPQEMTDEEIDAKLEAESLLAQAGDHTALSTRKPLDQVSGKDFEADLVQFLEGIGEDRLAKNVRRKHVGCNNTPIDMLGLYRAVVMHGGLTANEAYDPAGRYAGTINWAGDIFPSMSNYKRGHRATSIGTQLLSNYRKYLAAYERAWAAVDLPANPLPPGSGGLVPRDADGDEVGEGGAEQADGEADAALKSGSRQARKARSRYRDTGAVDGGGPPGASDEDWQPAATQRPKRQRRRRGSPKAEEGSAEPDAYRRESGSPDADNSSPEAEAEPAPTPTPARASKRQRKAAAVASAAPAAAPQDPEDAAEAATAAGAAAATPVAPPLTEQQMAAAAAELAVRQNEAGRPQPGSLLLAQDPGNPARLWPVLVAGGAQLPVRVAGGGAQSCRDTPVLKPLAQAAASGAVADAIPVVVLGSHAMGWVALDCCQQFAESTAQPPATAAPSPDGTMPADGGLHARALKLAMQLYRCGQQAAVQSAIEAVGTQHVAARLAALEGALSLAALRTIDWTPWAAWRRNLSRVETAAGLIPLITDLAAAIRPEALLPGAADLAQQLQQWLQTDRAPTVFGLDQAARGIWNAVNWRLLHEVAARDASSSAAPASATAEPPGAAAAEPISAAAAVEPTGISATMVSPPTQHSVAWDAAGAAAAADVLLPPQHDGQLYADPQMLYAQRQQQQQQLLQHWPLQQPQQQQQQQQQQQFEHHQLQHQLHHGQLHDRYEGWDALEQHEGQQQDVPLGRGHRKRAASARVNLAVQGEKVLIQLREQPHTQIQVG